jgi:hypothetical protein
VVAQIVRADALDADHSAGSRPRMGEILAPKREAGQVFTGIKPAWP